MEHISLWEVRGTQGSVTLGLETEPEQGSQVLVAPFSVSIRAHVLLRGAGNPSKIPAQMGPDH